MTASARRLTLRITGQAQGKLQTAADLVGVTLNQFVVRAALDKAQRIVEGESTMTLTRRESLRLLELSEDPPPRNDRFLRAQSRYRNTKSRAGSDAAGGI